MSRTMQVRIHFSGSVDERSQAGRASGEVLGDDAWVVSGSPSPTLAAHVAGLLASLEAMRPGGEQPVGKVDEASATDSGIAAAGAAEPGRSR